MKFVEFILESLKKNAEKIMICDQAGNRTTTYQKFEEIVFRLASAIRDRSTREKGFVLIRVPNCMEFFAAELACWISGFVPVPVGLTFPQGRIDHIAAQTEAEFTIDLNFCEAALQSEPAEAVIPQPEDNALLIFTSGSTGVPSGVLITHEAMDVKGRQTVIPETYYQDAVYGSSAQPFFIACYIVWGFIIRGGTVHLYDQELMKSPRDLEDYILRHEITVSYIPPAVLKYFHNRSPRLKAVIAAGEKLTGQCSKDGYTLFNLYGLSETIGIVGNYEVPTHPLEKVPFFVFKNIYESKVVDENGNEVPQGEIGELLIKGKTFKEYYKAPELTAAAFTDGWLHTKDLVYVNQDGSVQYVNRKDWMVKINGQRIEPGEIESIIRKIPFIQNVVVKGFKEENGGSYLCAYYIVKPECADTIDYEAEIKKQLEEKLMPYMVPSYFVQMEAFPLNANGKLNRLALKAPDISQYKNTYAAPENELQKQICEAFEKVLKIEHIGIDDDCFRLGCDSLHCMNFLSIMMNEHQVNIPAKAVYTYKTPRKISEFMAAYTEEDIESLSKKALLQDQELTPLQIYYVDYQLYSKRKVSTNHPLFITMDNDDTTVSRLKESLQNLLRKYSVFGTILTFNDEEKLVFRYCPDLIREVPVVYLKEEEIPAVKEEFVNYPPLFEHLLYKAAIYVTEKQCHVFLLLNHILFDGRSFSLIVKHIFDGMQGKPLESDHYYYYLQTQAQKRKAAKTAAKDYLWYNIEEESLYSKYPTPDFQSSRNSIANIILPVVHPFGVYRNALDKQNTTMTTAEIAAVLLALSRYNQTDKVMIDWFYNGRDEQWKEQLVGLTVYTFPVAVDFSKIKNHKELLEEITRQQTAAIAHGDCSECIGVYSPGQVERMQVNFKTDDEQSQDIPENANVEVGFDYRNASLAMFISVIDQKKDDEPFIWALCCNKERYSSESIQKFSEILLQSLDEILEIS